MPELQGMYPVRDIRTPQVIRAANYIYPLHHSIGTPQTPRRDATAPLTGIRGGRASFGVGGMGVKKK